MQSKSTRQQRRSSELIPVRNLTTGLATNLGHPTLHTLHTIHALYTMHTCHVQWPMHWFHVHITTSVRVISKFRNVHKFGNRSQIQER
jgi:hypothetical protein